MDILNIIQCLNLGGMERANLLHLQHFVQQGHQVRVISLHPLGPGADIYEQAGIKVYGCEYKGKFGILSHNQVRSLVRGLPADVIFVTGASLSSCLAACSRAVPRILFVHYHHGPSLREKIKWGLFYKILAPWFAKMAFCTDFIRQEAEAVCPYIRQKAVTVRYIFEVPQKSQLSDQTAARRTLGLPGDVPLIGNAGWFIRRKRFDVLLQVAALIRSQVSDIHVAIAGGGELEAELKEYAQKIGIADRVHWLGWLTDLTDFYRSLDILIFNSDFDALGRTPLEAMAHGVPVVASVVYGGLSEAIKHKKNGFLLEKHNVSRLAAYATLLLQDEEAKKILGKRGRNWIINTLSSEIIEQNLDNLLSDILK